MENASMERSVDGSKPPSRPTDEDVIRERTALRVQTIEPLPVGELLDEEEFARRYMGRMVVTARADEAIPAIEKLRRLVFCKSCEEFDELRLVRRVTELCVRYEDDELRAVPALAHCLCFGCGFEMYVNMKRKPDFRTREQKMQDEIRQARDRELEAMKSRQYQNSLQQQYQGLANAAANGLISPAQAAVQMGQHLGLPESQLQHLFQKAQEEERREKMSKMAPPPFRVRDYNHRG